MKKETNIEFTSEYARDKPLMANTKSLGKEFTNDRIRKGSNQTNHCSFTRGKERKKTLREANCQKNRSSCVLSLRMANMETITIPIIREETLIDLTRDPEIEVSGAMLQ